MKRRIAIPLLIFFLFGFIPAATAAAENSNILLITIDTLRPDRLSCYSTKYLETPAVDAVASKGILFEKAFAHNPTTLPSHANILLGTTPLVHGINENSKAKVSESFLTLAEHLRENGYSTGAFIGAFPLDSRFGLDQGFDVYDDSLPVKPGFAGTAAERNAEQVIEAASAWLSGQNEKWFCWIHLWDPHAPYFPPEPYASDFKDDLYSGEAAYVDAQLGVLFNELRKNGDIEQTLVVLTSDHGEALGEHGELTHGYFAYNSTIHVPLIIAGPGVGAGRVASNVSHIDIFPTVCDIARIRTPPGLQGRTLAGLMKGRQDRSVPIYFESLEPYLNKGCAPLWGFIDGSTKYMDSPLPEIYDLDSDFGEMKNIASEKDLGSFKKKLAGIKDSLTVAESEQETRIADPETLAKLRSLGYTASPGAKTKSVYGPEDDLKNILPYHQKLEGAILLSDQGKVDESIAEMSELIREKGDFSPVYPYLAQTYVSRGQMDEALRTLNQGVSSNPESYALLSAFGALLNQAGQHERATGILERALSILDFDPGVWDQLGFAAMRQKDYPKALEYLERAVGIDETYALGYSHIGTVRLSLFLGPNRNRENLALALENFGKAVELDPQLGIAFRGLGLARRAAGDLDGTVSAWERVIALNPYDDYVVINLGLVYLEKGDKNRARAAFEKYLELRKGRISPEEREKVLALIEKCK
jgi:arylsulfatase A-like enzyme/Flp pilus assembly protein TadD